MLEVMSSTRLLTNLAATLGEMNKARDLKV